MAHQFMPKIFHDPCKNPLTASPTYLMYGPYLKKNNSQTFKSSSCKKNFLQYVQLAYMYNYVQLLGTTCFD